LISVIVAGSCGVAAPALLIAVAVATAVVTEGVG
jgi:hypothetical protein